LSEEIQMYDELGYWKMLIDRIRLLAIEMQSNEQDWQYVTDGIYKLFADIESLDPASSDYRDFYILDFEHPNNPDYKLVFEFKVALKGEKS